MNDLIRISHDAQGASAVSARELYEALGFDKSNWLKWARKNIEQNPFAREGEDWHRLDIASNVEGGVFVPSTKTSKGGRPTVDYVLTIDFAERLSMLARTEKGEEIRRWFQAVKNKALQQPAPALSTTEQLLLQVVQQNAALLGQQQSMLDQLRADVRQIQDRGQNGPVKQLTLPGMSGTQIKPHPSGLRKQINRLVTDYSAAHGVDALETWNYLYKRMLGVYGISVYRLQRGPDEYYIDALERYGHLDKLLSLIMAELHYEE